MLFYVLLTYGHRPTGSVLKHPAARAQLAFIKRLVSPHPEIKVDLKFDYARRIDSLSALPALERVLSEVREIDGVKVRIDDLSRVFRITKTNNRKRLLADLQEFGACLFSIKHRKTLSDFSPDELHNLIVHAEKSKSPAQQNRSRDTAKARSSSASSRSSASIASASPVKRVKEELMDMTGKATLQMIADEANARGMRTTRGAKWTASNVGRVLDLLERAEQEE